MGLIRSNGEDLRGGGLGWRIENGRWEKEGDGKWKGCGEKGKRWDDEGKRNGEDRKK